MERDRLRENTPEQRPEPAPVRAPAPVPTDLAGTLLGYQSTLGNQLVVRLLEARAARAAHTGDDVAERIRARQGGGSPVPDTVRERVEAGLGTPLGDVRLHTDAPAAQLATELGAHAFTAGSDVFFNSGVYDPDSRTGFEVLAHELTHTVQQSTGTVAGRPVADGLRVSDPGDHDEVAARSAASAITAQRSVALTSGGGGSGGISVQRHSSWEHTLLGDTPPQQLAEATVTAQARKHLLADLWARMMFFSRDPSANPCEQFPDVRWIQLSGSGLWVSNGELNALADYLPDPTTIDSLPKDQMVPVLQKMRSGILAKTAPEFGLHGTEMAGMATNWMEFVNEDAGEVKALDAATAGELSNRYQGLLTRNACHFAPFSWQRWAEYHAQAEQEAKAHFASRTETGPLGDVPKSADSHARQAILAGGYGDHFLQDSFAAGHLVNKTLVMQWWLEFVQSRDWHGIPDPEVLKRMTTAAQPGIAGKDLYDHPPTEGGPTNAEDRRDGTRPTDPQTAQERTDRERRLAGSGVVGTDAADLEANYQAYLRLLNNTMAQKAAGEAHNYFNGLGLTVVSSDGNVQMRVGGDDTLISKSGPVGAEVAAHAAALSRQAIEELMNTGSTGITVDTIFALVPTKVVVDGVADPVPLEEWQDSVVRQICDTRLFPEYYKVLAKAIGSLSPEMVEGGMSPDADIPAPEEIPMMPFGA